MIATRTSELLLNLKKGVLDPADTAMLEQLSARDFVDELKSGYAVTFQERHIGRKWEVSLARSVRAELLIRPIAKGILASFRFVPAYLNCLTLNAENDLITGISRLTRLTVWGVKKPELGLALKTGRGFKLDNTPDGWVIKPMGKRIVKLSEEFLRGRGWRFDHLRQLVPIS